jgi:hypothetical protein
VSENIVLKRMFGSVGWKNDQIKEYEIDGTLQGEQETSQTNTNN